MFSKKFFEEIKKELQPLRKYGKAVILYGSVLTPYFIIKSDIDVAVITMKRKKEENIKVMHEILGKVNPDKYDVRIFELLPMYIKAEIIKNFKVVYGDKNEIGEYFYFWRKLCRDFERRKEITTPRDLITGRRRLKL